MPHMVMRSAVRLVLIGSLSRCQARQKFSRIKAGEHGAAEFLTKPVNFGLLKERLRQFGGVTGSGSAALDHDRPTTGS